MQFPTVGADPLGWEVAMLARADVPAFGVESGRPGAPRLRRVVDREPPLEPSVAPILAALRRGDLLPPQVTTQRNVVRHRGPQTRVAVREDCPAAIDIARPDRASGLIPSFKKFPGLSIEDSILRHTQENKSIRRRIGQRAIVRVRIDIPIPGPAVVPPVVHEAHQTELGEHPILELPRPRMIPGPCQLTLAPFSVGVSHGQIERALDAEHPPSLAAGAATAGLLGV